MFQQMKQQGREFNDKVIEFEDLINRQNSNYKQNEAKFKSLNEAIAQMHTKVELEHQDVFNLRSDLKKYTL